MTFDISRFRDLYPFQSHTLDRNGIRYHYLDEGEGEPVLCVHGNPSWSFYFRSIVSAFKGTHRVIVPDHIGCGLSDKPDDDRYSYRLSSRIDDLVALIDHLLIKENLTLVLHDWGGAIGMGLAAKRPALIKRMVILNTGAFHLPVSKPFPWPLYIFRNMKIGTWAALHLNAFSWIASYVAPQKWLDPRVREALTGPYDTPQNRIATLRFVQDIPLTPGDPSYAAIDEIQRALPFFNMVPKLICWGRTDFVFDRHFLREWKTYYPDAETHFFRDAGHYVLEDKPQEIVSLMKAFMARKVPRMERF